MDVAIVGAGPAGAAAALRALAVAPRSKVVMLDKADFPRDKACGDGVGPEGVDVLRGLDVLHVLDGFPPVTRIRLVGPDGVQAVGEAPRHGYVVPRTVFDARLVEAAVDRGADLVRERVTSVEPLRDRVCLNGHLEARVVIGADGANSVVRRAVGAGAQPRRACALAMRGYAPVPDPPPAAGGDGGAAGNGTVGVRGDEFLIAFVPERWPGYVWSFPTGTGLLNVGFGAFDSRDVDRRGDLTSMIRAWLPEVDVDPSSLRAHLLPLSTHRPDPAHGRVLLAGDAASLINPLTGEGIYYALLSGAIAGAAAVLRPDRAARAYRGALRRRLGRHLRHTALAAWWMRSTVPVELAVDAARRDPGVFDDVCEFSVGTGLITPEMVGQIAVAITRRGLGR